jgi:hypothetical protein
MLSDNLEFDSKSNLNSLEDFNNSSIRRTSALLSSINRILYFFSSILIHQKFFFNFKIEIFSNSMLLILNNIHFNIYNYFIKLLRILIFL